MSSSSSDGGPAFARSGNNCDSQSGMSLRDYFAAKAMQAMIGCFRNNMRGVENAPSAADSDIITFDREMAIDSGEGCKEIAEDAYAFADAMLRTREGAQP